MTVYEKMTNEIEALHDHMTECVSLGVKTPGLQALIRDSKEIRDRLPIEAAEFPLS